MKAQAISIMLLLFGEITLLSAVLACFCSDALTTWKHRATFADNGSILNLLFVSTVLYRALSEPRTSDLFFFFNCPRMITRSSRHSSSNHYATLALIGLRQAPVVDPSVVP
jgi:hypothetical protein